MVDLVLKMFISTGALFKHAPIIIPRPRSLVRSVARHADVRNGIASRHISGETDDAVSVGEDHSQCAA